MIRFTCPRCRAQLSAPADCAGRVSKCKCGQPLIVPQVPGQQLPPQDKTALGQMIGHSPTNLQPPAEAKRPLASQPPAPFKKAPLPSNPEKTAIGRVVAHTPNRIETRSQPRCVKTTAEKNTPQTWRGCIKSFEFQGRFTFLIDPRPAPFGTGALVGHRFCWRGGLVWNHFSNWHEFLQAGFGPSLRRNRITRQTTPNQRKTSKPAKKKEKTSPKNDPDKVKVETPPPEEKVPPPEEKKQSPEEKVPPLEEKKPPPEEKKLPPEEKKQPPIKLEPKGELDQFIVRLTTGTDEEKVKAADELALLGEKARPAARALCQASLSPNKAVSRSALQAIEKVAPELHDAVFTLVVDGQAVNHRKAIAALSIQGTKAKCTLPVMLHQIQKCQKDLKNQVEGRFGKKGFESSAWGSPTLVIGLSTDYLVTLPEIAPEEPDVVKAIVQTTRISFEGHMGFWSKIACRQKHRSGRLEFFSWEN